MPATTPENSPQGRAFLQPACQDRKLRSLIGSILRVRESSTRDSSMIAPIRRSVFGTHDFPKIRSTARRPPDVRPRPPQVVQDVLVVTIGVHQGVGQDRQIVEAALGVDGLGHPSDRRIVPGEPVGIDWNGAEGRRPDYSAEEGRRQHAAPGGAV